ncbi:protein kinase [Tahibacter sp. UC22_41]|uniref:protein kinase domain-containing protein n=1 Tax=Tahibacter sp. UC22_41 TaxID=3350178 RepID=UPI0036DD57CB
MSDERDLLALACAVFPGIDEAQSALDALDLTDPQQRRFGNYELIERIGRGGMGVVYRARQHSLGREVALKVIAGTNQDPEAVARLHAEARAAAQLHHPNIVPVYEVGLVDDVHFFSMPLLRGATLAQTLHGALAESTAIELTLTLARAVAYAHSLGLLHLDLKPANVLLDDAGRPLIGDFGLARAFDAAGDEEAVRGTPAYMAPEQIDRRLGALSPRSDVYALGAMLHEFLTGAPPHGNDVGTRLTAAAALRRGPRAVRPELGADIDAICRHCLETLSGDRYATVDELVADLARCRDGNAVGVRPRRWPERAWRSLRRHPALSLAVTLAALALLLGLLGTAWQWRRAEAARATAEHERAISSARAERLRQLAGLLAASFPAAEAGDTERRRSARDAVAWLTREAGADAAVQRELLDAFGQALRAAGKGDAVDTLLDEILRQRGAGYRHERLAALLARDDRDGLLALQWVAAGDTDAVARELAATGAARLAERYGDDADALYVLALGCSTGSIPCAPDIFARLTARAPDNAVHWILAPADEAPAMTRERLRQAARAQRFDDHLAAQTTLLRATLPPTAPPPELGEPLQGVLDTAEIGPSLRRRAIDAVPLPRYAAVVGLCRPDRAPAMNDAALRADCDAFGRLALDAPNVAILSRMIASAILRRLHPDDAIGRKAYDYRRQYVWLSEQFIQRGFDAEQLQQDVARYGEWEAWLRMADRSGVARMPPEDWKPKNPQALLLAEQRKP